MMNLTAITQAIKKISRVILIVATIVLLLGIIYFRFIRQATPPPPPLVAPLIQQDPLQKPAGSLDFTQIDPKDVPKELPVFASSQFPLTAQAAKTFAESLGISEESFLVQENTVDGTQYNWKQGDLDLSLSNTTMLFRNNQKPQIKTALSQSELQDKATTFIGQLALVDKDLVLNSAKIRYLSLDNRGLLKSEGSFEKTMILELSFEKKLNNLPLLSNSPYTSHATLRIAKDGTIIYLSSRFFENFAQLENYRLKSVEAAIQEINTGKGQIVQIVLLDENRQALEIFRFHPLPIQQAKITNFYLAYFLPLNPEEKIQPIYVAEGEFQYEKETASVTIYLPAINGLVYPKP